MGTTNTSSYKGLVPPTSGDAITMRDGKLEVPSEPIIPFIEGDGTGPDIWRASRHLFDAAVAKAYGGKRRIAWWAVGFAPSTSRFASNSTCTPASVRCATSRASRRQ